MHQDYFDQDFLLTNLQPLQQAKYKQEIVINLGGKITQ
jgi:hypothetical protein